MHALHQRFPAQCGRLCPRAPRQQRRLVVLASRTPHDHESTHQTAQQVLGTGAYTKAGEKNLEFRKAQVIRNEALNADNSARLVHLSISDQVEVLYGRKVQGVVDSPRWIDNYTMPGQFVALKLPGGQVTSRLYSIASTPYESRRDSTYLDASLIEVVAERGAGPDDSTLADLPPGAELEVSQVVGRGFAALLSTTNALQLALEEGRPVLCIAVGTRGMVPTRALLCWTPVQAHASANKVACLYASTSPATALFVQDWETWRQDGLKLHSVYSDGWDVDKTALSTDPAHHAKVEELLEKALFLREGGFNSLAGSSSEVVVLMAGLAGSVASSLTKKLIARGISHDRILFADFF